MPIDEKVYWIAGESDSCGILSWCLLPASRIPRPRAGDVFEVGLSVFAGIETNDHLPLLCLSTRVQQ
jgi:hypothetical protein